MHSIAQPTQSLSCGLGCGRTMQQGRNALRQHRVSDTLYLASNALPYGTSSSAQKRHARASCVSASTSRHSSSQSHTSAMITAPMHAAHGHHAWCSSSSIVPCNSRSANSSRSHVQARVFDKIRDFVNSNSSGWAGQTEASSAGQQQSSSEEDADEDGADMVRIDMESTGGLGGTTEEVFGPLAVLLVGFMPQEVDDFRALMNDMDADIVKLVPCTKDMLDRTLLQAFETEFPSYEQPPLGQRRAMFFSGMYGSELTEVISAYRDAGLPPCVFAGLVPKNANTTVADLLDSVWRDHAAMMAKLQQQQRDVDDSY